MRVFGRLYAWVIWQRVSVHEFRIKRPKTETAIVSAYAVFYIFAAVIIGYLIKHRPLPILNSASFITDVWYALVFKIGLLLIVPVIWFFLQGYHIQDLLPDWKLQLKSAMWIIVAYMAGLSLNLLQGHFDYISEAATHFSAGNLALRIALGVVLPLFMAGIPEEVVYRGGLQTRLELLFGRVAAICITVLLFTAWHLPTRFLLSQGVEGRAGDLGSVLLGTGVPVLMVGLIFGLLWDRYRSLPSLIAFHWGIDTLPTVISLLGVGY
jgi:membrane protease YdiL (CAAX protease family)